MLLGEGNTFHWEVGNYDYAGPAGLFHTPGASAYSTYVEVIAAASVVNDVYLIEIQMAGNNTSATDRRTNVNIGWKRTGEGSFSTVIAGLLATAAGSGGHPPIVYRFPLFIPAGTAIAVQASGIVATGFNVAVKLFGKPSRPELAKAGSYVTTFGTVSATAWGTAIVLSNGSKGAYTDFGAMSRPHWWWQVGLSTGSTTYGSGNIYLDVAAGDASNKKVILNDCIWASHASEISSMIPPTFPYEDVPSGNVYVRSAMNGALTQTPVTAAVYAVGG